LAKIVVEGARFEARDTGRVSANQFTRENLVRHATSLHGERLPMMLPGIPISAKPDDYAPFKTLRIAVFDGESWTLSGDPLSAG